MEVAHRQPRTAALPRRRTRLARVPIGFWFAAPFLVVYALFVLWPVVYGLYMSLFNASLTGSTGEFVGLRNWNELFGDGAMWSSLWHTVYFTVLSTPPLVVIGLVMALLTNRAMPLRWLWRFSFFTPFLLPVGVVALVWVFLFQPDFGFIDSVLKALGLGQVNWLTDPKIAMLSIVITTVWWTVGFNFLLYLAALQNIPQELYDAAALDGAGWWRRLWRVELPLLRRITGLVVVLQLLASLKIFDQVYLMVWGGPNNATRPVVQYIYESGFTNFRIGYAAAVSYFFLALVLIVSLAQFRLFGPREEN